MKINFNITHKQHRFINADADEVLFGGAAGGESVDECQPCAVCLQVMAEFCDADFEIITEDGKGGYNVYPFSALLTKPFRF